MKPVVSTIRRALLLALCVPLPARAAEPVINLGLVLLQPEELMAQRGTTVDAVDGYVARLLATANEALRSEFQRRPSGGFIALAVRPNGRSKVWFDFAPALPASTDNKLRTALEAVPPPDLKSGTVVFGIKLTLWGGSPPTRAAPAPSEWKAQAQQAARRLEVSELVDLVWPE